MVLATSPADTVYSSKRSNNHVIHSARVQAPHRIPPALLHTNRFRHNHRTNLIITCLPTSTILYILQSGDSVPACHSSLKMLYHLDYFVDMSARSTSRKRKFLASCAPRALSSILLYVFLFVVVLPGDQSSTVLTSRIPGIANSQERRPSSLSISAYARWHKQQRKCLLDPTCKDPPVLVWQCPQNNASKCAGVSDRIHGIQFSLLLSIATKRLFFIDWPSSPHRLDDVLIPATFDWTYPTSLDRKSPVLNWFFDSERQDDIERGYTPSIHHLPGPCERDHSFNLEVDDVRAGLQKHPVLTIWTRLSPHLIQNIKSNANLDNPFSIYKNTSILDVQRMLLASLFKPSRDLTKVMNSVKIDTERDYYSIHLKTGKNASEDQYLPFLNGKRTMNDMVKEILKCMKQERNLGHVFVASDSKKFKSLLKEKAMVENIKVFISKHPVRSLDMQTLQVASHEEKSLSFHYYFADLFLLGGGKGIITTESNFAKIAFLFGTASKLINMKGLSCKS